MVTKKCGQKIANIVDKTLPKRVYINYTKRKKYYTNSVQVPGVNHDVVSRVWGLGAFTCIVYYDLSKYQVDGFVGELTF